MSQMSHPVNCHTNVMYVTNMTYSLPLLHFREFIKKQSVELISVAYNQLYKVICDPYNLYREPETIVPRTPDQVQQLLL